MNAMDMHREPTFKSLGDAVPVIMDCLSHVPFRFEVSDNRIEVYRESSGRKQDQKPEISLNQNSEDTENWCVCSKHWPEVTCTSLDKAVGRFTLGCLAVKTMLTRR